ncbi:DUF3943 domain-containing protein [Spirochaeta cellobiosiphila]|uniref:DUF3943 domain-containing protein n=1 Tax=Spirochaeta cellobiosiphila TaxID=504483 RepID=UPI000405C1D2|nr:DUF3943 domain-containing protein [Spirochaeta cellobiosiphila]
MTQRRILLILLLTITISVFGSSNEEQIPSTSALYWGTFFWNPVIWGPQLVAGIDYAAIYPQMWTRHLSNPWVWDNDEFSVNQLGHPYQGSLAYGSARGAGWDFNHSVYATMVSSVTWELFMENETPSKNDFIITTLGGTASGEIAYRLSQAIQGRFRRGIPGITGSALSWTLSPGGNISDIIYNQPDPTSLAPFQYEIGVGYDVTQQSGQSADMFSKDKDYNNLLLNYNIHYGDIRTKTKVPYDIFSVEGFAGFRYNDFYGSFFSKGLLWGTPMYINKHMDNLLGIYMHYDFVYSDVFNLSANSLGVGWQNQIDNVYIQSNWESYLSFLALGSSENLHLKKIDQIYGEPEVERRSYDIGFGSNVKLDYTLQVKPINTNLYMNNYFYFMYIYPEAVPKGGSSGFALKNNWQLGLEKIVSEDTKIFLRYYRWNSDTRYENLDNTSYTLEGLRLGISYTYN